MSRIGADPVALRQLGSTLSKLANHVDHSAASLERQVRGSSWRGQDARDFLREWHQRHRPSLQAISGACLQGSTQLKRQAEQQEQASDGASSALLANPLAAQQTPARLPAPFPKSELRLLSGMQITAGALVVGVTQNLTIQHLSDKQLRVTSTERNQAGLAATAGASISLGTQNISLGANLRGQIAVAQLTRREYTTTQNNLLPTIALIEAEAALGRAVTASAGMPGLGIGSWFLTQIAPMASRTETLTELNLSAQGSASLASALGIQAVARGGGSFRFGQGHNSQVLELEGSSASLLSGQLLQRIRFASVGDAGTEVHLSRVRIEIPERSTPNRPTQGADLILSTTTTDGHHEHRSVTNMELSESAKMESVEGVTRALRFLEQGELGQAVHSLSGLDLPVADSLTRSGEFSVSEHTGILGATLGAGVGLGISTDGGMQQLRLVS